QPIVENLSKIGETNALSKPVTSNSVSIPQESKGVNNDKVIALGMFRINPDKTSREAKKVPNMVIQICLWCVDSGCSKHMTGNLKLLINYIWKFIGIVRFGNDHVDAILGFGDLQWGNILITRVYFVEGLGHNLFSVGQFCDSDLEVAFRRNACFVRNLEGVDLLKGHRLPKFEYHKEHLCPSCEQGKSKRASHPPKPVPNSRQRLHLLHMDLCGPMRIASINGKR
nr:retrovirus-related Pol polyprotein from transposon TNT 1-94 [Tanacetum cinerariifolium]